MRVRRRAASRIASGVLIASLGLVAGCGGDGGDSGSASEKEKSSSSEPDYEAASKAIQELSDAYGEVYEASVDAQKQATAYIKANPKASLDVPEITESQEALTEAAKKRDELREDLADLTALEDPEVKAAYDAFIAKAEDQDQFNDTFYAAFPAYSMSLRRCLPVTQVVKNTSPTTDDPKLYGALLVKAYDKVAADCMPFLEELAASENAMVKAYADHSITAVEGRRAAFAKLASGQFNTSQASDEYVKVSTQFNKDLNADTTFQQQMTKLNARAELIAFDKAVDAKVAEEKK